MKKIASVLIGISSPNAKLYFPLLVALSLTAIVLFTGGCSEDEVNTDGLFQPQPLPETQDWLFTVYGTSVNDVYVAGAKGVMFHYDGNAQNEWTQVALSTSKAITQIWGAGDGTMYAIGHGGTILRSTGGSWSGMTSGTSKNLYGIGRFKGDVIACGHEGAILKLNGSSWGGLSGLSWVLDDAGAPTDTLEFNEDIASLTTVNSFFIGGAFHDPNFIGEPDGMIGTRGGVFQEADHTTLPPYEPDTGAYGVLPGWILRPLSGEQIVDAEWMLSTTSDPAALSRNYLGTSEGWLFQLSDARGDTVWTKYYPAVTDDPGAGIQNMWLDGPGNVYMVTDEGKIIYQTFDYNFTNETGSRSILFDGPVSLTGIWGSDPGNFFVVGYMDEMIIRCSHDPATGDFSFVEIPVDFPADKAMESGPTVDKFGRPLH